MSVTFIYRQKWISVFVITWPVFQNTVTYKQLLIKLKLCYYLNRFISIFIKSHEKRLITKKHIVTPTHLYFVFKWALHLSTLAIKLFYQ